MAATADNGSQIPWHSAYPEPRSEPGCISRQQVLQLLKQDTASGKAFVIIDLRRIDHEGGSILGSINLPAQTLWPSIPSLYNVFKAARISQVIWYCGSSRGRGTRAAAWFADYINEQKDADMVSLVLTGGIKAWAAEQDEYVRYMQEYDESKW